ncbi:hypothetical protein NKG94_33760 [Micromonospora sp. M12]
MSSAVHATSFSRPTARALIIAQLAAIGAFLAVLVLYLGRMVAAGVGPADMATGAYDPKDMVPFGMDG